MTMRKIDRDKTSPLHRIRAVRLTEGLSLRTIARRTRVPVSVLVKQERADSDLTLSQLHFWQEALKVPMHELLQEPGGNLEPTLGARAHLLRIAKTAHSLLKESRTHATRRMAQNLVDQLVTIMPELREQRPWHDRGTLRSSSDVGRIAEHVVDTNWLKASSE